MVSVVVVVLGWDCYLHLSNTILCSVDTVHYAGKGRSVLRKIKTKNISIKNCESLFYKKLIFILKFAWVGVPQLFSGTLIESSTDLLFRSVELEIFSQLTLLRLTKLLVSQFGYIFNMTIFLFRQLNSLLRLIYSSLGNSYLEL